MHRRPIEILKRFITIFGDPFHSFRVEDPQGTSFKLNQSTAIADYQSLLGISFQSLFFLLARALLSCFISGKTRNSSGITCIAITFLSQGNWVSKAAEDNSRRYPICLNLGSINHIAIPQTSDKPPLLQLPTLFPQNQSFSTYQWVSTQEMQLRQEKSLCFNCNEKFHPEHKCKK